MTRRGIRTPAWLWVAFLAAEGLIVGLYLGNAWIGYGRALYALAATGAVIAVLVGVAAHRPERPSIWIALGTAIILLSIGDFEHVGVSGTWALSAAGAITEVGALGTIAGGAYFLVQRFRSMERIALIDGSIVGIAAVLVLWYGVVSLTLRSLGSTNLMISVASAAIAIVVLTTLLPLIWRRETRSASLGFLALAFLALPVAELSGGLASATGVLEARSEFDGAMLLGYAAIGTAALHPSMRFVGQAPEASGEAADGVLRTLMVAIALLVGPGIILLHGLGLLAGGELHVRLAGHGRHRRSRVVAVPLIIRPAQAQRAAAGG